MGTNKVPALQRLPKQEILSPKRVFCLSHQNTIRRQAIEQIGYKLRRGVSELFGWVQPWEVRVLTVSLYLNILTKENRQQVLPQDKQKALELQRNLTFESEVKSPF